MTLDKYTNLKKIVSAVFEKIKKTKQKKKRKIFQKLAVLLRAYIELKFRTS